MKKVIKLGFVMYVLSVTIINATGAEKKRVSNEERNLTKVLMEEVASTLNDPRSAQFRGLALNMNTKTLCGEINFKNSYGGYVGFRWFARTEGKGGVILPETPGVAREKIIEILNSPVGKDGSENSVQCSLK